MADSIEAMRQYFLRGQAAGERYRLRSPRGEPHGSAGMHLGRSAGQSLEFLDHRDYQPGDDLRQVDWAAYARTDKLTLKMYRQEVFPHLDLLLDSSQSMALPGSRKMEAASGLAAALCTAGRNAGFGHRVYRTSPAYQEIGGSGHEAAAWQPFETVADGDLVAALRQARSPWRRRSVRVLISDLLFESRPKDMLVPLLHDASALAVIHIVCRQDSRGPEKGNLRLLDAETGHEQELYLDDAAIELYRHCFERHLAEWRQAASEVGAMFVTLSDEDVCGTWELAPLVESELLNCV